MHDCYAEQKIEELGYEIKGEPNFTALSLTRMEGMISSRTAGTEHVGGAIRSIRTN